jgi:uncharacterized protein YdaU (DUF1376 family)
MTDLPFQKWFEADFESDPDVEDLPWLTQQVWRCVLQKMWKRGGWLPADDKLCARALGCDVRRWRGYKDALVPLLRREVAPYIGAIYRQKRVVSDREIALEVQAKNKERSAKAAAASAAIRSSKSTKPASNKLSSKQATNGELQARHEAQLEASTRALARKPEPEEPSSPIGDDGSGFRAHEVHAPARPPVVSDGLAGAKVEHFTGPFMPASPAPPAPKAKSTFLQMLDEQWNGDAKAYNEWRAHQRATAKAIGETDAAQQPIEEEPDERRDAVTPKSDPEPSPDPKPGDDDLDDFIRF